MSTLSDYSPAEIRDFRSRMQAALNDAGQLQAAAQTCARLLYEEFPESIVLARLFVTLPFKDLPARDDDFGTLRADAGLDEALRDVHSGEQFVETREPSEADFVARRSRALFLLVCLNLAPEFERHAE